MREGNARKFVAEVEHRTFSGAYAVKRGQPVLYVTERCVFRLTPEGLELTEVAPGIDIERDILAHMDFKPLIKNPQPMDGGIFAAGRMGLRERLSELPLGNRFSYDAKLRMLFIDFRNLTVASQGDIARIKVEVEKRVRPLGHRVYAIVNYRGCRIDRGLVDSYWRMVQELEETCYVEVTRYGTSRALPQPDAGDRAFSHDLPRTA